MSYVNIITNSPDKLASARIVFNKYNIDLQQLAVDMPEIQANSSVEIARFAVLQAYQSFRTPVIREDHSFFISELGFPGPFMSYADKAISPIQLLKILDTLESRAAYFELGAAYCDDVGNVYEFSYKVPVVMAREVQGNEHSGWECLMKFPGDTKTFAELEPSDRVEIWTRNYESIAKVICH